MGTIIAIIISSMCLMGSLIANVTATPYFKEDEQSLRVVTGILIMMFTGIIAYLI